MSSDGKIRDFTEIIFELNNIYKRPQLLVKFEGKKLSLVLVKI